MTASDPSGVPPGLFAGARSREPMAPRDAGGPPRQPPRNGGGGGRPPRGPLRPRFRFWRRFAGASLGAVILVGATGGLIVWHKYALLTHDLPTVDSLTHYQPPVMSRVYSSDSRVMAELAAERRIFVPYSAIPDRVKQAFVAVEDQNFWTHGGVDPLAILRAAVTDVTMMHEHRRPVGASTITQQVARNMLLGSNTLSLERKAQEAILAMRIEQVLSKERILEIYLNEIYLGAGAYGIVAAAQTYFNKPLDELTIAEAASLAALPKSPTNYNPFRFPDAARTRRNFVLERMVETGAITRAQAAEAEAEPLIPRNFHRPDPIPGAGWYAEEVRRQLVGMYGTAQTNEGGLVVQTSLDPRLQAEAARDLRAGLLAYDRAHEPWHGTVTHLNDITAEASSWGPALAQVAAPAGMLSSWRLAVILPGKPQGRVGWLELDIGPGGKVSEGAPHTGQLSSGDRFWMRNPHPGDVVMIEPSRKDALGRRAEAKGVDATEPDAEGGGDTLTLRTIPKVSGALVALNPRTGRVAALVGGWSYEASQFDRATQAQRQPGSSFKPIVYLAAMEQGISPSQQFMDAPYVNGSWRPNNYEMDFNGPTSLHDALMESLNLVTVRLAAHVGMGNIADLAIALHEVDAMPKVLPAALGAVETTVLREAGAYASIEQGGRLVTPSLIDSVQDRDGRVIYRAPGFDLGTQTAGDAQIPYVAQAQVQPDANGKVHGLPAVVQPALDPAVATPAAPGADALPEIIDTRTRVADPDSAFQITTMMQDVIRRGTGTRAGSGIEQPIAGKTGTTQDFNDAWFVGYAPQMLTAVWIGYDTPKSLGEKETGGNVAGPIWNRFMKFALNGQPKVEFRAPPGVVLARWGSGRGTALDAFKLDQKPGESIGLGGVAVAGADMGNGLTDADTGTEADNAGIASSGDYAGAAAVPVAGASGSPPVPGQRPPPKPATGSDIGVGGLY